MKFQPKLSKLCAPEKSLQYLYSLMVELGLLWKPLVYEFSDANFGMLIASNHKNKATFILEIQEVFSMKVVLFLWIYAFNMLKLTSENSWLWDRGAPQFLTKRLETKSFWSSEGVILAISINPETPAEKF